jgi:hypothetical protein
VAEVAAEVAAHRHRGHARQTERGRGAAVAPAPRAQRPAVQAEPDHVGYGVNGAHTLIGAVTVRPVGRSRRRCRQGRQQPERDEDVGGVLAALLRHEIEDGRAGERADRDVGQQRMKRMAEAGSAQ